MVATLKRAAVLTLAATWTMPLAAQEVTASAELPPDGTSLVFVNTQAILPVAPGADSAQARFQAVVSQFEAELAGLATQIDSMLADYRRQESLMGQAGREQKQQEILDLQRSAQQRQQELDVQSQQRRNELLAPILQRVTDVIEEIRSERGYAMVFDIAESGVIAADNSLDITGAVLERLGVDPSALTANSGR
ncbi:MAG: OmpH family outer membrane protein [Gemmatimonadetes bacterium]|nr:OmpH family outer membrane protein [Gemmatimonadota bacterium]